MIYAVLAGIPEVAVILFAWSRYGILTWSKESVRKISVLSLILTALSVTMNVLMYRQQYRPVTCINLMIVFTVLAAAAGIDYKKQIIPNRLILAGLACRVILLGAEFIMYPDTARQSLLMSCAGMLFGLLLLLILSFLTRRGIGYGDVKLFAWLGLCIGVMDLYNVLFYSVLFAAITGIFLLAAKKADKKQKMPFAPFVFMGSYVVFIMALL